MISLFTASVAAAVSIAVACAAQGRLGLEAAGLGVGVGALMCAVSAALGAFTRRLRGQAVLAGMLGSVGAGFAIMALAMVLIARWWRPALDAASLTALATYLGYRFASVLQLSASPRTARGGSA